MVERTTLHSSEDIQVPLLDSPPRGRGLRITADRRMTPPGVSLSPCLQNKITMTGPAEAASAGLMIVVSLVLGAAVGYGIGSAIGAAKVLAFAGGFLGLFMGLWLVYTRFKDI
jgi:hypothetical protein